MKGVENPAKQVQRYIDGVLDGTIVTGEDVKRAVRRHVHDLEHAGKRGHRFDEKRANLAVLWFPVCLRHVEGEWAGKPVVLSDNQAFIIWCIFGWRRADDTRRFRHVYVSCARKWGKSTIAAGICLLCLTMDDPLEPAAQIYCAATKEDQARIVHRLSQTMADNSPELKKQLNVMAKSITTKGKSFQPNSFFKPIGSDSRTADGFNLHVAVIDEVHEWQEHHHGLWDKLNTASGSRRNWMVVTITTAGDDKSELWNSIEDLCQTALNGYEADEPPGDNRFVFIARLDGKRACSCESLPDCEQCGGTGEIPEDDIFDPVNWPKANPNYPVTPKPDFLKEQASDAKTNAKSLHAFKRYHCNIKVSSLSRAIDDPVWARAKGEFSDWDDADVICGAWDLGGQDDLGSIGLCAKFDTGEKEIDQQTGEPTGRPIYRYEIDSVGYINSETERDLTVEPWSQWINENIVRVHSMELAEMRAEVVREWRDNSVRSWAFDPHTSRDFAQSLEPEGIEAVKFHQNAGTWTEPLTRFLSDLKRGRIRHDGNGLLSWAASNLITVEMSRKASIQIMPDKGQSTGKIDPIVAVIMAYRLATVAPPRSKGKLFIC
jgi:phage terminase large subunit-like protein